MLGKLMIKKILFEPPTDCDQLRFLDIINLFKYNFLCGLSMTDLTSPILIPLNNACIRQFKMPQVWRIGTRVFLFPFGVTLTIKTGWAPRLQH